MTQEDILRMAREAGFYSNHGTVFVNGCDIGADMCRFYALAAAAERAACADICDQHASIEGIAQRCAAEIRKRGNK